MCIIIINDNIDDIKVWIVEGPDREEPGDEDHAPEDAPRGGILSYVVGRVY